MERDVGEHRDELLSGLSGRVVEIGAGNGMNFPHYPSAVEEVVALEPEAYLREKAEQAARGAPVPVRVDDAAAYPLPLEAASLDAAVARLVLCTVPEPARALAELRRVLKPGAELRFMEHVSIHARRGYKSASTAGASGRVSAAAAIAPATPSAPSRRRASESSGSAASTSARAWIITNPHVLGVARADESGRA